MAGSIVSFKSFTYRGAAEEWSNRYHFQGDAPSTPADWRALCDDFALLEAPITTDVNNIVRFLCYTSDSPPAAYSYNLASFGGVVPGGYPVGSSGDLQEAGDAAGLIRWNTGRLSTKGKPVYLFKYYHGVLHESGSPDQLRHTLKADYATFANDVMSPSGNWPGLAGPDGVVPVGYLAETYITTRTLKRRGRRPT